MSLRFVLGRSGSGKTTVLLQEMMHQLKDDPNGPLMVYIVPDQMTFSTEYKLVSNPQLQGMMRLQVYSFPRLAWRVLQETGGISRLHINTTGVQMLIRKIINDNKDRMQMFKQSADKFGFVEHIENMVSEFKRYCLTPEELAIHANLAASDPTLQAKIHDLELIYGQFEKVIRNKYLASEDYLQLLAEKIPESKLLKNIQVFIDGFHSFTPQEYAVIEALLKHAGQVTVALTVDYPYRSFMPDDYHLFRMPGETYAMLFEIAEINGIPVEGDLVLHEQHRFNHPSLRHLEQTFEKLPAEPFEGDPNIYICEASNLRAEIEGVGRKIISLVRDKDLRYKDIAILVRNSTGYHELFETIFADYQIPYYIDQKRSMLNHPLIELVRSTLEVITGYWRYDPIFRAVKTDLLFPLNGNIHVLREKMDRLENYCLAFGIQGKKWTSKERWPYRRLRGLDFDYPQTDEERAIEQEINESRLLISAPILRLARRMNNAKTGKERCTALFLYLEELDIPAKLEKMQIAAEEKGNLILAREHEQAWTEMLNLLDQYVEILGNEEVTLKQFAEIIEAGLESLRFSLVPPAVDQVIIADLEMSRLSDVKVAFVIGLNDDVLPMKFQDDGVLSDEEREQLITSGIKLAPTNLKKILDEDFVAYKAFTTPSDALFISYPLANEEGKALMPSPYIKRLKEMFPNAHELEFHHEANHLEPEEQLEFLMNWNEALTHVTYQLQQYKRGYKIADLWWDSYNLLIEHKKEDTRHVLQSIFYENKAQKLSEQTVKELYGDTIQASISRMEKFNSCAFSHFMSHGLRLEERKIFRLEAPDIGELFHGALKYIGDQVQQENLSWGQLTNKQIRQLVLKAVEYLTPRLKNQILLSTNRYQYIKRKLEKVILRATEVIERHAKSSQFVPYKLELQFGPKGDLPPVQFQLKNGTKMELVGRIDRVDKAENDQGVFLRVIDYKSSDRDLKLDEVYYGLALQMLTYLDIIIRYSEKLIGKQADPAGVLYFHIHNLMIASNKVLTTDEIEEEIFKKFKMKGYVLADSEVVRMMDQTLESGTSKIISAGVTKKGTLDKRSKVMTKEDFNDLRHYIQYVFEQTGNEIMDGKVDIDPYKLKNKIPCTFCPFKSICQFDPTMKENNYRHLPSLSAQDALNQVKGVVKP